MRSLEEIKYKYIPNSNGKFEIIISFNIFILIIQKYINSYIINYKFLKLILFNI